jgi:hypothetical protein
VISQEVEQALVETVRKHNASVIEFSVAPQVSPTGGGPAYHEWFIAFESPPTDMVAFAKDLDQAMVHKNIYYQDLIVGNILRPLVVTQVEKTGFAQYMKSIGKLGGQNKVPRLQNNRTIADALAPYLLRK